MFNFVSNKLVHFLKLMCSVYAYLYFLKEHNIMTEMDIDKRREVCRIISQTLLTVFTSKLKSQLILYMQIEIVIHYREFTE